LEEREQRQQQQNDNDPEGEIAQIGVHRSSFVVARIAAVLLDSPVRGNAPARLLYNLSAALVAAKGTTQDYLTHVAAIPVQIMAVR
jgi:hypothetical protein